MPRQTLALQVGPVGAPHIRPLVPVEAQPGQAIQNRRLRFSAVAALVGVLHAQDEAASLAAGKGPIEEGGAGQAQVNAARGARRYADANAHGGKCTASRVGFGPSDS